MYSTVLDHAALVVAENHHAHAVELLPGWWDVHVADEDADGVATLLHTRTGGPNLGIDPLSVAQLRWRDEALAELIERGADRGVRSTPRRAVRQRLVETLDLPDLQSVDASFAELNRE